MSARKINVTFYHSAMCPRCQLSGLLLRRILPNHPDIAVTKVEFLTNRDRAREDGMTSIPALVAQGRSLSGIILTRRCMDGFLASLTAAAEQP